MWCGMEMQYSDLLFALAIGYAIGRTVGYCMQLRSERKWEACLERMEGWGRPRVAQELVPASPFWRGQVDSGAE